MIARITGYGPNASDARVAEVRRVFAAVGEDIERAASLAPEDSVVLHGREVWMQALRGAGMTAPEVGFVGDAGPVYSLATVDRAELADLLTRLGREGDAAKVRSGPPDQPQPDGARLLVCLVDEICVAVTWSQGTPPPSGARFFDARGIL